MVASSSLTATLNTTRRCSRTRLVYILAASHSGSTLLARLLAQHPDVCTVGELKATSLHDPDRYLCSCQSPLRECGFWAAISSRMANMGFTFDVAEAGTDFRSLSSRYARWLLQPLHRGAVSERLRDASLWLSPSWRRHLSRVQARNAALVACVCAETRKRVIVDSSKDAVRLKFLLRNPSLGIRVLRLVRDGRAVALTYTDPSIFADAREPRFRGGGTGDAELHARASLSRAAHEWRRSNEEAGAILQTLDRSQWTEVRYEALCTDPKGTLSRLFTFIGVDNNDPAVLSEPITGHHVIGNGMRFDFPLEIRLDQRWRVALTDGALNTFDGVAGTLNRALGYS
jgi:hypothetical protein